MVATRTIPQSTKSGDPVDPGVGPGARPPMAGVQGPAEPLDVLAPVRRDRRREDRPRAPPGRRAGRRPGSPTPLRSQQTASDSKAIVASDADRLPLRVQVVALDRSRRTGRDEEDHQQDGLVGERRAPARAASRPKNEIGSPRIASPVREPDHAAPEQARRHVEHGDEDADDAPAGRLRLLRDRAAEQGDRVQQPGDHQQEQLGRQQPLPADDAVDGEDDRRRAASGRTASTRGPAPRA